MSQMPILAVMLVVQQAVQFEVASIRPRPEQPERGIETVTQLGPSQIRLVYVSLADCIALAYRMSRDRIVGPDWLGTTRFDLAATLPPGTARHQVPERLQALLAQRFRLQIHRETRELPGYALENRSAKLEPAVPEPVAAHEPLTTTLNGSGAGILSTFQAGRAMRSKRRDSRSEG